MTRTPPKLVLLAALAHEPVFSNLHALPSMHSGPGRNLLRWLDQSGLALMLFRRLQRHNAVTQIPGVWREALESRQARNVERTEDMLREACRVQNAFSSFGIRVACLKGFSLSPDFCEDPFVRHQVDFDLMVSPDRVHRAAEVLRFCGYRAANVNESSETCFVTPLRHIPSSNDDLYALQRHRQIDLHLAVWEPCRWFAPEIPQDCLDFAEPQRIKGLAFLGLSLEDKFLLQVLHVFRHSFRSWIRLSWLLELAHCMEKHAKNRRLWDRVIYRSSTGRLTKTIYAFVLGLVQRLFCTPIPEPLNSWQGAAISPTLQAWLSHFALDWALSDWPGSLNNLFLAAEFIPNRSDRLKYWQSRLFPGTTQTSLGAIATASAKNFLQLQAARLNYVARRAAVHLTGIADLPRQQLRWRRALAATRGSGLRANS